MISLSSVKPLTPDEIKKVVKHLADNYAVPGFMPVIDPSYICIPTCSHIGGYPYWNWEIKPDFPCDAQGKPLRLLCQIDFQDVAYAAHRKMQRKYCDKFLVDFEKIMPDHGLLQIFIKDVNLDAEFNPLDLNEDEYTSVFWPEIPAEDVSLTPDELVKRLETNKFGFKANDFGYMDWARHREWPVNRQMRIKFKGIMCVPHEYDTELFNLCYLRAMNECLGREQAEFDPGLPPVANQRMLIDKLGGATFKTALMYKLGINYKDSSWCMGMMLGVPNFAPRSPFYSLRYQLSERYGVTDNYDSLFLRLWTRDFSDRNGFATNFMASRSTLDFVINSEKLKNWDFSDLKMYWRHDYAEIYPDPADEPIVSKRRRRKGDDEKSDKPRRHYHRRPKYDRMSKPVPTLPGF